MLTNTKTDALKRLRFIQGHLEGITKMIEQDKYCVDVLKQTFAVRRAIQQLEKGLLDGHIRSCVVEGLKNGNDEQVVGELLELYSLSDKR